MSTPAPVLLILGAGPNIGHSVAQAFTAKGYRVALTSRKAKSFPAQDNLVSVTADLSQPESVAEVFSKVKAEFGAAPSVVVYNAGAATMNPPTDPLSIPVSSFANDLNINTTSVFAAAQQAVQGFKDLPASASKTFIYTGNITNMSPIAPLIDLGVGKSATAHLIRAAAEAYGAQGFKFYYADERRSDGAPAFRDISGEAHGEMYVSLAEEEDQGPWQQTFVKGTGYVDFAKQGGN